MLKKLLIWFLTVIAVIAVATFLISIVYIIDTPKIDENIIESKETLIKESSHYSLGDHYTDILDNHTDSHMLLIASYRGDESLLNKGMNSYFYLNSGNSPYDQLTQDEQESLPDKLAYYRYWHGYVLLLRPLLVFFNYGQIRTINMIAHIVVLGILIFLMIRKKLGLYVIPLLSVYIMMNPIVLFNSLQNSTIWYITCVSIIVYLLFKDKIIENKMHYLLFTVTGMVTSFMDFLTYPITTLGLLLIIVLLSEDLSFKEQIKRILLCGTCWTLGYGIMWAAKWVIASIVIGKNVIQNALDAILFRSSNETTEYSFSRIILVRDMFILCMFTLTYIMIAINAIVCFVLFIFNLIKGGLARYGIIKNDKEEKFYKKYNVKPFLKHFLNTLPVLSIGLVSMVWYYVLANHSQIHPFLSIRTSYSFWVAVFVWIYKLVIINNKKEIVNE